MPDNPAQETYFRRQARLHEEDGLRHISYDEVAYGPNADWPDIVNQLVDEVRSLRLRLDILEGIIKNGND